MLGFLMIRSRQLEIILPRTLGKENRSIYLEYALKQTVCIIAGTVIGGLAFQRELKSHPGILQGAIFCLTANRTICIIQLESVLVN